MKFIHRIAVLVLALVLALLAGMGPNAFQGPMDGALADETDGDLGDGLIVKPPYAWHDPACIGDKQRYTLEITNNTRMTLTNVEVVDTLPDVCPARCDVCLWDGGDWPYDDCTPGWMYDGMHTVRWQIPALEPGETRTFYVEIRLWSSVPDGAVLENCVTVSSDQTGPVTVCSESAARLCEPPTEVPPTRTPTHTLTPPATPTATDTPGPSPTPTHTPTATNTPGPSPTPTAIPTIPTIPPVYKLYIPDLVNGMPPLPPTPTPTASPTPRPMPIQQCFGSAPGECLVYRVDASLFRGYERDSAGDSPLIPITSPPAPAGWNQPAFVPDSSWRPGATVWWDAWSGSGWSPLFPGAVIIGLMDAGGNREGVDGVTHLIRHHFHLTPPQPGWRITSAVLDMWSDNKTAWWWEGTLVMIDRQQFGGQVELFPAYVAPEGGMYVLAVQNSNDYMRIENPQGTAFRLCVTWALQ